jgi:hypothetical protein
VGSRLIREGRNKGRKRGRRGRRGGRRKGRGGIKIKNKK